MSKQRKMLSGKSISGMDVLNPSHENLGEIKDIMIDPITGNIVYAVLTFGGFMGFGEKYFAIPWEAFYLDTNEDEKVILNISKEKFENAPGFDQDNWPSAGQWEFVDKIYRHYGYKSYTHSKPIGGRTGVPAETALRDNSGIGNSGKLSTFDKGRITSSRIKETGISR